MAPESREGDPPVPQPTENMQLDAHRSMKRFRATGMETPLPEMLAMEGKSIDARLDLGTGRNMSWRDTLVQPSNGTKEGSYTEQDLVSLDEEYGLDENLVAQSQEAIRVRASPSLKEQWPGCVLHGKTH